MLVALTRAVPPSIARCELTHLEREPIDLALAESQHRAYEQALQAAGCTVRRLPPEPDLPDSVFVEDAAVVLDEVAVITRPGAVSRRPEIPTVEEALAGFRPLLRIEAPATLDGGDVLRLGSRIFVGLSGRSNAAAVAQLGRLLEPYGYSVEGVSVRGCLHLKTAVTRAADDAVLLNPAWVHPGGFRGWRAIEVHPEEPMAANVLRIGEHALFPTAYPRTRQRLEAAGIRVTPVEAGELARAEGALTCCSLVFRDHRTGDPSQPRRQEVTAEDI